MHGRLKVRSTEEELARKKKEQILKVKAYRAAMSKIQAKRREQELDDEMLTITGQILLRSPDVATLWNVRRECIEKKAQSLEDDVERQKVFDAELGLTEQCLMMNPKSYAGWHQRCWALENCPEANWERELQLCNKYLKLDERNFHTWDHRRYVVAKASVAKQKELDFCTEMIKTNFSNYSSWTYRSQLLPVLYPCEKELQPARPMSEAKLQKELEMVLTAAFTDPNDSSAWFYQRWLLGNSQPELDVGAFRINSQLAVLATTKSVPKQNFTVNMNTQAGDLLLQLDLQSFHQTPTDTIWVAAINDKIKLDVTSETAPAIDVHLTGSCAKQLPLIPCHEGFCYFKPPAFSMAFSAAVIDELESQLESCVCLLDYEPDSKWTLLTSALLMRAINHKRYHTKSLEFLQKLQKVDALREGYYKDLASKWVMEKVLEDWRQSDDFPSKANLRGVEHLASICYDQYLSIADVVELPDDLKKAYDVANKQPPSFAAIKLQIK